jgi:peptide/nickel transport system ATP-binding protein
MRIENILEIQDLTLRTDDRKLTELVSIRIPRGKTTGLVGESGSGKTLTALSILQLLPPKIHVGNGSVTFHSRVGSSFELASLAEKALSHIRGGKISMIFQEPMTSLNPSMTCGKQIMEAILMHRNISKKEAHMEAMRFIHEVKLPEPARIMNAWPHQLSGGQRQRVMIAMALSTGPELLIADEPTTALDVTVQKKILDLLLELKDKYSLSILFITHDLMVLKQVADEIAVMYRGKIVETGPVEKVLNHPDKEYTRALIACKPGLGSNPEKLPTIADFTLNEKPSGQPVKKAASHIDKKIPILTVRNLTTWFNVRGSHDPLKAVNAVSFEIYKGETLGLVGESGSGKTTLGRSILQLITIQSGDVIFKGTRINELSTRKMRNFRKHIQVVFQDPYSSLNPRFTAGKIIMEPMEIHQTFRTKKERTARALKLLEQVGLSAEDMNKYPHQFSGGQRQRICIARAIACEPELIILDESVSALDVSIQAQILNLLNELKRSHGLTYIFISHDLTVVKYMSDRVLIMKNGNLIESGSSDKVYMHPEHPYTRDLINAIPQ